MIRLGVRTETNFGGSYASGDVKSQTTQIENTYNCLKIFTLSSWRQCMGMDSSQGHVNIAKVEFLRVMLYRLKVPKTCSFFIKIFLEGDLSIRGSNYGKFTHLYFYWVSFFDCRDFFCTLVVILLEHLTSSAWKDLNSYAEIIVWSMLKYIF